jgi:hypothetical protein
MADPLPQHSGTMVGLQFALKIIVRHVVVSLDLNGEALAQDLGANADLVQRMGEGDATADKSSKFAAGAMREIAEAAREAEAERQSGG